MSDQKVLEIFFFIKSSSLFDILNIIEMGINIDIKINDKMIGLTIIPNNFENLIQLLFKKFNFSGLHIVKNKKNKTINKFVINK